MTDKSMDACRMELKRLLESSPERGWIFGVCATIARRTGWALWAVRTVAVILLLSMTFLTGIAYFCAAMLFAETRPGAQEKLTRWARQADRLTAALGRGIRNLVRDHEGGTSPY